jgi:hypothetical protein
LLLVCGPPDVARGVWAIIINSINGEMWVRSVTNIGKEIEEVVPAWIDFDAARAIIFVCFVFWIAASFVHAAPNSVERMTFFFGSCIAVAIASDYASARLNVTTLKMGYSDGVRVSTMALTQPVDLASGVFSDWSDCDQLSETLVGDIQLSAATARLNMAIVEIGGDNDMGVAAVTLAEPSPTFGALSTYSVELSDCDQSAETLIRDIECFGHRTKLHWFVSSSGTGVGSISSAAQYTIES